MVLVDCVGCCLHDKRSVRGVLGQPGDDGVRERRIIYADVKEINSP